MTTVFNGSFTSQQDYQLIMSCSQHALDVVHNGDSLSLTRMNARKRLHSWWKRVVCWLLSGSDDRLDRMAFYVKLACEKAPPCGTAEKILAFYSKLRTWKGVSFDPRLLSKAVLNHVSPGYACASVALAQSPPEKVPQNTLNLAIAVTECAAALGIPPVSAARGSNGTMFGRFGRGLDGRPLTVIKKNPLDRNVAEGVAYLASEWFGFDLVPPTCTRADGASVQLFLPPTLVLRADNNELGLKDKRLTDPEKELLQLKALFNYFIGEVNAKDGKVLLALDSRYYSASQTGDSSRITN